MRRPLVDAVCRALTQAARVAAVSDPGRAQGQQRYMKSVLPYRGLTNDALRRALRPVLADPQLACASPDELWATARHLWDNAAYREDRYAVQTLLRGRRYAAWLTPAALPTLAHLIVTGAWWDHVDELAAHPVGAVLRADPAAVTPVLRRWMVATEPLASAQPGSAAAASDPRVEDGAMWLRRTAILSQLQFRVATDVTLLGDALSANLETDADGEPTAYGTQFFIRKAVGWALRQHARVDPAWVRAFVAEHEGRMSGLSRREALKHLGPTG